RRITSPSGRGRRWPGTRAGRYRQPGYEAARWTPDEVALLGAMPDEEMARRTGPTVSAVQQRRYEQPGDECAFWMPEELTLLGTMPDAEVARRTGRKES